MPDDSTEVEIEAPTPVPLQVQEGWVPETEPIVPPPAQEQAPTPTPEAPEEEPEPDPAGSCRPDSGDALSTHTCNDCGEAFTNRDWDDGDYHETDNGDIICDDCRSHSYFACVSCDCIFHVDDSHQAGDSAYCQSCFDQNYIHCHGCGDPVRNGNAYNSERDNYSYCESCYSDRYATCLQCETEFARADLGSRGRCEECSPATPPSPTPNQFFPMSTAEIPSDSFNRVKFRRKYGVELESSKSLIQNGQTCFASVRDGSTNGPEYNSPIMQGDHGMEEIDKLCSHEVSVDANCGFHLHLDARDLSPIEVIRITKGYNIMQNLLFALVAKSRQNNQFCKRLRMDWASLQTDSDLLFQYYGTRSKEDYKYKEAIQGKGHEKRYEFLNLHSYFFRGSIEIRLHQGTFSPRKILNWINLHQAIFEIFKEEESTDINNEDLALQEILRACPSIAPYLKERLARFHHSNWQAYVACIDRALQTIAREASQKAILQDQHRYENERS